MDLIKYRQLADDSNLFFEQRCEGFVVIHDDRWYWFSERKRAEVFFDAYVSVMGEKLA